MIDTINDGTLYLRGASVRVLCEERVQTGRYAADYGVAFPDLLNTACGEGPVTTHEIVPTFFKNKSHDTENRGTSPTIVANLNYHFR